MPPYGEYAAHHHDSGARRRPREEPAHQQYPSQRPVPTRQHHQHQQYPSQRPPVPPPQQNQRKRRDTVESSNSHAQQSKRPRVRFTAPLAAPLLSQVATMSGFLRKQADNEPGKWTKYYFVLKPTTYLYYYTSDRDPEPRGIIDVEFLKDVRLNADCVQRSVGGSAHAFRMTGQLPAPLCPKGQDPNKTQFRPVYLDAESRDQADAWMDAIRHHRFDLERHRDYDDLMDSMDEVEEQLTAMTQQTKDLAIVARQVLRRGKELVCNLRGVEMDDDGGRPRGMSHADDDVGATVASIGLILDELFAEADRQRRLAEMLRQREGESAQNNTQLKECQAELTIQRTRCERFEAEVQALRDDMRVQQQGYDTRYGELVARERQLLAREKELLTQIKEREKLCDQRMQEVDLKSSKWSKELEKEATRRNAELEKKRKALEKQQKALDQKQKVLEKRLQETPAPSKLRFAVGAIGKSRAAKEEHDDDDDEPDHDDDDDDEVEAVPTKAARSKSRFKRPGFLRRKRTGAAAGAMAHEPEDDEPEHEETVMDHETAMESDDSFDVPPLSTRGRHRAMTVATQSSLGDRSSDASTTRLSGVSYSSSINTPYGSRSGRAQTTTALPPTLERTRSASRRSASVPAGSGLSAVFNGVTVRLPPEWTHKESKKYLGSYYYYNRLTGETRWEFPYDAAFESDASSELPRGGYGGYGGPRASSRASSVDDGNDFVTTHDAAEHEDISAFLSRTRANTRRRPPKQETSGSWSTRDKFPPASEKADPLMLSWESKYYSDAAMAIRMGIEPEEPEEPEELEDLGMGTIKEDESFHAGKGRGWGRKFPKLRGKTHHEVGLTGTAKSIAGEPVDGPSSKKGWKLMPKVPFRKGSHAKAPPPDVPRDTDPIVHDNGRCEF